MMQYNPYEYEDNEGVYDDMRDADVDLVSEFELYEEELYVDDSEESAMEHTIQSQESLNAVRMMYNSQDGDGLPW